MAPIFSAGLGITPQIIDDAKLIELRQSLAAVELRMPLGKAYATPEEVEVPLDIDRLVSLIEPWQEWTFEEQVDLHEWIQPLNKIDACLSYYIQKYPATLLIGPVKRATSLEHTGSGHEFVSVPANSLDEVNSVPEEVFKNLAIILRFVSGLVANSFNKIVFNSVEELVDLLAAADDGIATAALQVLCNLATPPVLHKQQAPEMQQHSSALHASRTSSHKRLVAMARGWGSRGSGLGLYTCCTADDSEFGQGALPQDAGELHFSFVKQSQSLDDKSETDDSDDSMMVELTLQKKDIIDDSSIATETVKGSDESDESSVSKQKRRRVAPVTLGEKSIRSTPELFFECLEKAGGRDQIPDDKLFSLLCDIRLARAFHCRATRLAALERRLLAIITILQAHPSQEILSGYFQAQPELCVELIDLLRATVSSASVSAAASKSLPQGMASTRNDALAALANPTTVPYRIREFALQALTALVGRRDGTTGALTGVARHSNVLNELGVGKGQYLGLLPTLIRFSLASLASVVSAEEVSMELGTAGQSEEESIAFDIGIAFVQATAAPPLPRNEQLLKALEFIDSVLTLTSAVVSTQSGTSALTECGLIPALLTTVSVDHEEIVEKSGLGASLSDDALRIKALLRFVAAQAVQIIEGAIVTQNNALTAFHDLNGVEVLTARLSKDILGATAWIESTRSGGDAMDTDDVTPLRCSQRVLLFSIVTCLTVVFHQESTSSSTTTPSGAVQLRKPELTRALINILENIDIFGGHLGSLVATLLADVMNSDPHVVKHVHDSGLANAFLANFSGNEDDEPLLPPVPELIMAVPNVLSALALTEDGARALEEANPFPALLKIFYHPKFAMPRSRCLLNEMTSIVGTGLDEIMRHITSLKPLICSAIAGAMNKVAEMGEALAAREKEIQDGSFARNGPANDLEDERSFLMQYALNFGQLLEQILHSEEHTTPFVSAGGLDALLRLHPCLMPTGREFLSHLCCLSCPSVSTLSHSATEDALTLAFRCIALKYDPFELVKTLINSVSTQLSALEERQAAMRRALPSGHNVEDALDATFILEGLPCDAIYTLLSDPLSPADLKNIIADYFRQVVVVQWVTGLLSSAIKAACQRSQDLGTGWSRQEREWKKELSSTSFEEIVGRLSKFHQTALFEACRVRTQDGFEEREKQRRKPGQSKRLRYRLRIVCPEGAVVRDGIEIDSCASVGNMEMGEIAPAFDRCVNSSGVLRYRTPRGWISEQTRGHGREPIAEVLSVWEAEEDNSLYSVETVEEGRIEAGVPDIRTTGANVLARLQGSYSELYLALSKVVMQGVRSVPVRTISFQQGTIGAHVATIMRIMKGGIYSGLNVNGIGARIRQREAASIVNEACIAMYLGCMLAHLRTCLFEEKRERRTVNVPLLIVLSGLKETTGVALPDGEHATVFGAMKFIFDQALLDFEAHSGEAAHDENGKLVSRRRQSRSTAASLPAATAVLKRLMSGPSVTSSPISSVLSRVKLADLVLLLGERDSSELAPTFDGDQETFSPERFFRGLLCTLSNTVECLWTDKKFVYAPPFVAHPIAMLVSDLMVALEDSTKKVNAPARNARESGLWNAFRGLVANRAGSASSNLDQDFEPSDEAVNRLMEMGFSRDHAWVAIDTTRSNQLEVAMEYALSHPPPSPDEVQRRRTAAEARRRQREQRNQVNEPSSEEGAPPVPVPVNENVEENPSSDTMEVERQTDDTKSIDESVESAKSCIEKWKIQVTDVSCSMLAALKSGRLEPDSMSTPTPSSYTEGDGDSEALAVVLATCLLDICQKYSDQVDRVAETLFESVSAQLSEIKADESINFEVTEGREHGFSALCHAAVLFTRALPKSRIHILKHGLVRKVVSCIESWTKASGEGAHPVWLASCLLLLDIMAQPMVAFAGNEKDVPRELSAITDELEQVENEHRDQANELSVLARDLFVALNKGRSSPFEEKIHEEVANSPAARASSNESSGEDVSNDVSKSDDNLLFKSVPAYFPLLPLSSARKCVGICLHILGGSCKSPGIIHGTLLLLLRLLRSTSTSIYCVKAGLAEKILALPSESRFTGHSGLVTLIFRRLLEDEDTLQAAMETEIRGIMSKLHAKNHSASSSDKSPSVPRKAFVQAITPLLCREPSCFLKAVAVTVVFDSAGSDGSSDGRVTLLSTQERAKGMKIVSDLGKAKKHPPPNDSTPARRSSLGRAKKPNPSPRSRTPVRSNKRGLTPKRSKKEKNDHKDKIDDDVRVPATIITGQLISYLIKTSEFVVTGSANDDSHRADFGFESCFLWAADTLGILSDLVLAIPACATSIHKFRPNKHKASRHRGLSCVQHALKGCQAPPKTLVSFLLHYLLIQDRATSRSGHQLWDRRMNDKVVEEEKKAIKHAAFRRTKISQATARLLFALVARPGEGRRRLIAELAFALSGGLLGLSATSSPPSKTIADSRASDVHALQAWGELCIGLAAPRNSGSNYEGNSTLSFEVIRIMLDVGIAHALLVAIQKVPLNHPRAASAVAALVLPFEVLSRPSVNDAVNALVEKEAATKDSKENMKGSKSSSSDNGKERNDSFADDHMLEDAFALQASQGQEIIDAEVGETFVDAGELHAPQGEDVHQEFVVAADDPHMEEVEIEEGHLEIDDEMDEDDESDEDMSSSRESDDESREGDDEDSDEDDEDDDEEDDEDDDEDEDSDSESIIEDDVSPDSDDGDYGADYRDDMLVENPDFDDLEGDAGPEGVEQPIGDGWTRIETSGFGGMVLGSRRGLGQQLGGNVSARTRGFIDAAEAMIGSLLRTGEIQGDALAELEGSLGIRIINQGAASGGSDRQPTHLRASLPAGFANQAGFYRGTNGTERNRAEIVGTLPQINQRNQPDIGYSNVGDGRRWHVSSMEYVYGGPYLNAGSRNYDLIASPLEAAEEAVPTISQIDAPLFPGGPATVAHARTQHTLHPLLCGVDLPPVNALVSDLLPHGVRETRQGLLSTRPQGDWTNTSLPGGGLLLSTSNGNIIRSNRVHAGVSLSMSTQPRAVLGPVGWTDDGLPFDATVEEFSSAFEQALGEAMSAQSGRARENAAAGPPINSSEIAVDESQPGDRTADVPMADESVVGPSAAPDEEVDDVHDSSDGDGVATSLATGLTLSPRAGPSEETVDTGAADAEMTEASAPENNPEPHGDERGVDNGASPEPEDNISAHSAHAQQGAAPQESTAQEGAEPAFPSSNLNELVCPPDVDPDVFNALPVEMQREVVEQARATADVESQLDAGSSLDPETLAALPEDVRREVIEQEQRERRMQSQAPADPANAEEMDNASFVASLAPDLREEILLTADDAFLQSLPANFRTEAQILRERASLNRRAYEEPVAGGQQGAVSNHEDVGHRSGHGRDADNGVSNVTRRKQRAFGKMRVETDRDAVVHVPSERSQRLSPPVAKSDVEAFIRLMYLLSPVRPQKLIHKVLQNMASVPRLRHVLTSALIRLLHDDNQGAKAAVKTLEQAYNGDDDWRSVIDGLFGGNAKEFPPLFLIGAPPEVFEPDFPNPNLNLIRRKQNSDTAASIAANLPITARGSRHDRYLPPVVANRIVDTLQNICKNSPRFCINLLVEGLVNGGDIADTHLTGFDRLLDLLEKPRYTKSSANLEQLLVLIESAVSPLSNLPKNGEDDAEISQKDLDAAASAGKEWVDVPRIVVSQERLQLLCSILRMETCRDTSFAKVNTIARRLCRIDANRGYVLAELASVARALGADAIRDLKALNIQMSNAASLKSHSESFRDESNADANMDDARGGTKSTGRASSSVAVSTSTSELKLLRVLQTLQALCTDGLDENSARKDGNVYVTSELVQLLRAMDLDGLWAELSSCLKVVQVLEGVHIEENSDKTSDDNDGDDENGDAGRKLQNSVAGLLTRFLPSIESFFVANASATRLPEKGSKDDGDDGNEQDEQYNLVGGNRLVEFVTANKVLVNALVRNNSGLLDKGLRALVHVPTCRHLLDFDVKRHWFKSQVRRLRQQANRRHGSLRLHISRRNVLIDAYHQLRLRNADEMRGRLHITFRDEQGVDAGGLSREFFGILAKEIFNPNYALFTSTEDGSTFQPNPNSSINPDHLSYFRFVGRIVGKAVLDGYLLDAHFTRSLYKHMLGIKPTHHDMEAIDPDYYKNLKTILEYDLGDLGLDLTFSIEDHSFGRSRMIDLIPNGRNVAVTEQNKSKYVSLVCQHRMTNAISSQINAYLDGFYELVSRDLITIFTPRELELLISGLPDIDVHDLKQNTDYVGWKASDQQIQWFWNALFSLSRNQKAAFLQFVTGSSKVPLAGFGELPGMRGVQKFSIHKAGGAAGALMSAHTCFNSLDLPVYNSEEELKEKLLYAITEGGGGFLLA